MKPSNHYNQFIRSRICNEHLDQPEVSVWRRLEAHVGQKHRKCSRRRSKGCGRQLTVDKYRHGALTTAGGDHHEGCSDMSELPVWRRFPQTPRSARGEEEAVVMALPGSRGCW